MVPDPDAPRVDDAPFPDSGNDGAVRWLAVSMLLATLLPTALFLATAWTTYVNALEEAGAKVDRVARVVQEHSQRVLETAETVVARARDAVGPATNDEIRAREREFHERLTRIASTSSPVHRVWVADDLGRFIVSSLRYPVDVRSDASGRDYFRFHQAGRDGSYLGELVTGRVTGDTYFTLSHARRDPAGAFAGVLGVSLLPEPLHEFHRLVARDEPGLAVSLLRRDGRFLTRWPAPPKGIVALPADSPLLGRLLAGPPEGRVTAASAVDGRMRMVAYRPIEGHEVYVTASLDLEQVLAAWRTTVARLAAFTFPTAAGLVFVSWIALRRTRRAREAVIRMHVESARRERAEGALRQAQKLEAIGRLTGGVAHDFNNLLMVINNNAHLLARLPAGAPVDTQVGAIRRAVASGQKLTRQLLSFARRQTLIPQVLRLQERLPALLELTAPVLGKQVTVTVSVAPEVASIKVDPSELELAFLNLAINARDAMPDGGTLAIFAHNARDAELGSRQGRHVVLGVADNGVGIDRDVLDRIFEPFFTTKEPGKGTGLGLSQVYGFCAQAGGFCRVVSTPGNGATVLMYFPACDEPAAGPVEAATVARAASLRGTVLLVEDNAEVAASTVALLEGVGATVRHVSDGTQALAALATDGHRYDAVLSDVVMPGSCSGIDLALAVRRRDPRLPVVLMTGYTEERDRAIRLGLRVLAKPCAPEGIVGALRAAIASAAAGRKPST